MKYLILTTHEPTLRWRTIDAKKKAILTALRLGKGGDAWEVVDIKYIDVKPVVKGTKIDAWWLENICKPYFSQGYDMISLHSSEKQWKDWGIVGMRGANPNKVHEMESMYFSADENTLRNRFNRFIQVCLHETAHGYYDKVGGTDKTHEYHDANRDITGLFATFNWDKYQPVRRKLRQIRDLLIKKKNLLTQPKANNDLLPLVARKAELVIREMERRGHPVRIVEGFRSIERQNELYAQGRTKPGNIVTNARGGESFHNYGVAVDFVFRKEGYNATQRQWEMLGQVGESVGFSWGGRWKNFIDRPHFELTFKYSLKDFQNGTIDWSKYK